MSASDVLGWDIGGANVKATRVEGGSADSVTVVERYLPLWKERDRLPDVLQAMADELDPDRHVGRMAVTMTAELADCFATKREGVAYVVDAVTRLQPDRDVWVYGVDGRFRRPDAAKAAYLTVAAANWMATAAVLANTYRDVLLVDVGSTTTDVIPIMAGTVAAGGRTDPERLMRGELVYTGALRTPVCAIISSVTLRGRRYRVAAEHFAIAADVHRWLDRVSEADYACETPDGRDRGRHEAAARLARVVCADLEMLEPIDITSLATQIAFAQVRQITAGIRDVLRGCGPDTRLPVVATGLGAFLAQSAAQEAGLELVEPGASLPAAAARVAPALAVARLLRASSTP